jgi:transcription initiation factor TFIIH subunit 1
MTSKITSSKESTFHGVTYNKTRGSLILSESGLQFNPDNKGEEALIDLSWTQIIKHQVSPATHPKHLMKVIVKNNSSTAAGATNDAAPGAKSNNSHTFEFLIRNGLESARRDVSTRLNKIRSNDTNNNIGDANKKRPREEEASSSSATAKLLRQSSSPPSSSYITHDPVALISTRSSLLASDPALRAQHRLLVVQNATLSEEDFWETHSRLMADEYAKISGCRNEGMGSNIKSSLDLGLSTGKKKDDETGGVGRGVIHLGVEEMRQIFLMYPAVHRAYEEKVPLELSEEQFWRKYLERYVCVSCVG